MSMKALIKSHVTVTHHRLCLSKPWQRLTLGSSQVKRVTNQGILGVTDVSSEISNLSLVSEGNMELYYRYGFIVNYLQYLFSLVLKTKP